MTVTLDSHVDFYCVGRLRGLALMDGTSKAISMAMTDYFIVLGCVCRWQTGRDASGNVAFSVYPNQNDAVDAVNRNHLERLAFRGLSRCLSTTLVKGKLRSTTKSTSAAARLLSLKSWTNLVLLRWPWRGCCDLTKQ